MFSLDKEKKVYQVFQSISEDYDSMNDIISFRRHRSWKRALLEKITRHHYESILDICCGTGDIALDLAQSNPLASVTGLDFSENMLTVAEKRKTERSLSNIQFCHGNAMQLPFADCSFQCVTISFGLRNVSDYEQVLRDAFRILKNGGAFYCLDSSYPDSPIIKPFFRLYFKYIMPTFGSLFAQHKEEYKWLNDSTEDFLKKKELIELMQKAGFRETGVRSFLLGSAALHTGYK